MTERNASHLIDLLADEVAEQLERAALRAKFSRLGGLMFDREVRAMMQYLTSMATFAIRDKFRRLTQLATLLNMEQLGEIYDYCYAAPAAASPSASSAAAAVPRYKWSLTPSEVKQVLLRRVDFAADDVRRLKL